MPYCCCWIPMYSASYLAALSAFVCNYIWPPAGWRFSSLATTIHMHCILNCWAVLVTSHIFVLLEIVNVLMLAEALTAVEGPVCNAIGKIRQWRIIIAIMQPSTTHHRSFYLIVSRHLSIYIYLCFSVLEHSTWNRGFESHQGWGIIHFILFHLFPEQVFAVELGAVTRVWLAFRVLIFTKKTYTYPCGFEVLSVIWEEYFECCNDHAHPFIQLHWTAPTL